MDAMRRLAALAVLLAAACGSTRRIDVPPPFEQDGVLVTLRPRARHEFFGTESIGGEVENRTDRDVDLVLWLSLENETGKVVGHAAVFAGGLHRGEKRSFDATAVPGPPALFPLVLFPAPPHYTKVGPGPAYTEESIARNSMIRFAVVVGWMLLQPIL